MLLLGDNRDSLGGEDSVDADLLEVELGTPPEDLTELGG
jgi:hypothetical protein